MDTLKFHGDTLGQRHRNYNKFVAEKAGTQTEEILTDIDENADDVHNLFRIDVASRKRDVEYILKVLKGNDLLYVLRVIKKCDWLVTDNQHAHIINPQYLHSQLFPNMMTKAFNRLILNIRLTLRDENRVESFFNYYENYNINTALKWLPNCSTSFIELKVEQHFSSIEPRSLSRICKKNASVLKIMVDNRNQYSARKMARHFGSTLFLLKTHTDFFLDLVESCNADDFPTFNSKYTKFLMTHHPQRIHQNIEKYLYSVHIPTFVTFLNKNLIKDFLLKNVEYIRAEMRYMCHDEGVLQYFIKRMPQEERWLFIKDALSNINNDPKRQDIMNLNEVIATCFCRNHNDFYLYAPFDVAFHEIKDKIKLISAPEEKRRLLNCLPKNVGNNPQHLEELLRYCNENFPKAKYEEKIEFTDDLCIYTDVYKYNATCWSLLNKIFASMNFFDEDFEYSKPEWSGGEPIEMNSILAIIIYKMMNQEEVPGSLKKYVDQYINNYYDYYRYKLKPDDREQFFAVFHDYLIKKIECNDFKNAVLFVENKDLLRLILNLLNHRRRNLADYPNVLKKIKHLFQLNKELGRKDDLTWIYDLNKTWRKHMFEESIILCPCQRACMNALKHDPGLLSRYDEEVTQLRYDDTIFLKQILYKLKIYWPQSLGSEWAQDYRSHLEQPAGHRALMRGLSCLLPQDDMLDLINKYKPETEQIDWVDDNVITISLTKHLANNMHYARPQPDPDMILQYAKGDYLQYALPSLHAILHNMRAARCGELVPRLLDSPVSLQKHGIRLTFSKIQSQDLLQTICYSWKRFRNLSIRAVVFKLTYELLCKEKSAENVKNIWALLEAFIEGLTFEEDKTIYELLTKVDSIPNQVKVLYLMKSYKFFESFLTESDIDRRQIETSIESLIKVITDLIESESIDPKLVAHMLLDYNDTKIPLLISYILYTRSKDEQIRRYELVLLPVLKHTLDALKSNDTIPHDFQGILDCLTDKFTDAVKKNMISPVAVFSDIISNLEGSLNNTKHYLFLRKWKMMAAFAGILYEKQITTAESQSCWEGLCEKIIPEFSRICLQFLKDDMKLFFPRIYVHFSKPLKSVADWIFSWRLQVEFFKRLLTEDLVESYLLIINVMPRTWGSNT